MLYYYIILSLRFTTVAAPLDLPTMRDGNDLPIPAPRSYRTDFLNGNYCFVIRKIDD